MVAVFYGVTPDPLSPFLLAHTLLGDKAIQDQAFIAEVAPVTANAFVDWPHDGSAIPATPSNLSLLSNMEIQASINSRLINIHLGNIFSIKILLTMM